MRRLGIQLSMLVAVMAGMWRIHERRCSSTASDAYDIAQYNWDGHYGSAITLADWDNDGWPDLTFGRHELGPFARGETWAALGLK